MSLDQVVPILQTGLSGFAFLLAFLAYNLIAREQRSEKPRFAVLRAARGFLYQCIGLAVVVAASQIGAKFVRADFDGAEIARCRDSIDLLEERKQRATELVHLQGAIEEHLRQCSNIIVKLDEAK